MKHCYQNAIAATVAILAVTAEASANSFVAEIGGASIDDQGGAEIALGYRLSKDRFHITPSFGGFLYQGENDRYREETFGNGNTICRDTENGQFADDEKCNNLEVDWYGKLDAAYSLSWGEFGLGVRVSEDETTPYGKLGVYIGERSAIQFLGGDDYFGVGLLFGR